MIYIIVENPLVKLLMMIYLKLQDYIWKLKVIDKDRFTISGLDRKYPGRCFNA